MRVSEVDGIPVEIARVDLGSVDLDVLGITIAAAADADVDRSNIVFYKKLPELEAKTTPSLPERDAGITPEGGQHGH
jgi:hypothetical protein